jgi:tetratricopeptide (TPR) repeat protein
MMLARELFVGRDYELAAFDAAFSDVCEGHGRLLLVGGEPGIGKTHLLAAFQARVSSRDARVLLGRCHEGGNPPALWPWLQIVREYLRITDPDEARAALRESANALVTALPAIRDVLPEARGESAADAGDARFRFFDGVTAFLEAATGERPLVLMFDDIHWADVASLLLLRFAARHLRSARVLAVAAYRSRGSQAEPEPELALKDLLAESTADHLELAPLTQAEQSALVSAVMGRAATEEEIAWLHATTDGHPLFLRELLTSLLAGDRAAPLPPTRSAATPLPSGVRALVRERVGHLSATCREVLGLGAAIGREFDLLQVGSLLEGGDPGGALAAVEEASAQGILSSDPSRPGIYRFSHALVRDIVYDLIPFGERARLHERLGELLVRLLETDPELSSAHVAHHFARAAEGGLAVQRAARWSVTAGEEAHRRFSFERAAQQYESALQLADLDPSTAPVWRCETLLALSEARALAADAAGSQAAVLEAASIARRIGDTRLLAQAALGTRWKLDGGVDWDRLALLEEALDALPSADSPLRARLLARTALALYSVSGSWSRRQTLADEGVAMARRLGDPRVHAYTLAARLLALWGPDDDPGERIPLAVETLAAARAADDRELALQAVGFLVMEHLELGELTEVNRNMAVQAEMAAAYRVPQYKWHAVTWRAMRAFLDGDFARAEEFGREALAHGQAYDPGLAAPGFGALLVALWREQDRLQELTALFSGFTELGSFGAAIRCALALAFVESGRIEEARQELTALATDGFALIPRDASWMPAVAGIVEVCVQLRDRDSGRTLYAMLRPYAHRSVMIGAGSASWGSVKRLLGRLAMLLERWDEAERWFEEARALHERMASPPLLARTSCDHAEMLLQRGGDPQRAAALLEHARKTAEQIGAAAILRRARELAAAKHPPAPASGPRLRLTREGEVWSVAFAGRVIRMRDVRGLHHLALLTRHPGWDFHVLDLARAAPDEQDAPAHRRHIAGIRSQLEEAHARGDRERIHELRRELDAELLELAREDASWRDGADLDAVIERARLNVTRALTRATRRLAAQDGALGAHLESALRSGTYCSYVVASA